MSTGEIERLPARTALLPREDAAHCRAWIARHSKSFYLSSLLLPRPVRQASWALYAFCRRADDAVDDDRPGDGEAARLRAVAGLRARLGRVYGDGTGARTLPGEREAGGGDPVDRSYARVASRHGIPRGVPEALLLGMEMDARGAAFPTWDALLLYCFRVASTVGLMMARTMGVSRRDGLLRAAELGLAMQLTNIARDVGEDARRGRVYLPDELLAACGCDREAVLRAREATPAIREATRRLLLRADELYGSAERGIALLPRSCRPAIASARFIYAAIGGRIAAAAHDAITRRARTSLARKLALVLRSLPWVLSRVGPPSPSPSPSPWDGPLDALLRREIAACGLELPA